MNATKTKQKQKRTYRKITPHVVSQFKIAQVTEGNNTAAVRATEGEILAPHARAHKIVKKSNNMSAEAYIEDKLQELGSKAIDRIGQLTQSKDEAIATRNAQYVVDHIRGKAVNKNVSVTLKHNIQSVLD